MGSSPGPSTGRKQSFSVLFLREYEVLMVNCAWRDQKMHQSNTCTDGKLHVDGENHKTEWVTGFQQNAKIQHDFLILPNCTIVFFQI